MFHLQVDGLTYEYDVVMHKKLTLKKFIEDVMKFDNDWGYIAIKPSGAIIEYRKGKLISLPSKDILKTKVKAARAAGERNRMDYTLELEW